MKTEERRYPVHIAQVPRTWWARTAAFRRFFAREISAVFIGTFSVLLFLLLLALSRGPEEYEGFLRWLRLPGIIALSFVILGAVLYHAVTWFRLTTAVLPVRIGGKEIPRGRVFAGLVLAWLAASGVVAYFHIWWR